MDEELTLANQTPVEDNDGTPGPNTDRVRANVWIQRALHDEVMAIAKEEDATITTMVRRALRELVKKHKGV